MANEMFSYSPVARRKREGGGGCVNGELNSVFGHIFTKNYSKVKTSFYFAFSSLTLQAFTMLYFSYI